MLKDVNHKKNISSLILVILLNIISIISYAQPTNSNCANATQLCYNLAVSGTTIDATTECGVVEDCAAVGTICYQASNTVWYKFTSNAAGGNVDITISNIISCSGTNTQLQAAFFSATTACDLSAYNVLDCNSGSSDDFTLSGSVDPNTQYYIQVDGEETSNPAAACNFDITISSTGVELIVDRIATSPSCQGECDGEVTTSITGGQSTYSYLWSEGSTTSSITDCSGNYGVTVTDSEGCKASVAASIFATDTINANTTATDPSCFGDTDGSVSTAAVGGSGTYTYKWSNSSTEESLSDLSPGTYTVTTTDENGCNSTSSVTLEETEEIVPSTSTTSSADTCGLGDGTSSISTITGGSGPGTYTYLWSDGQTTNPAENLSEDAELEVIITDINGCTASPQSSTVGSFLLGSGSASANKTLIEVGENPPPVLTAIYNHSAAEYRWEPMSGGLRNLASPTAFGLKETTTFTVTMSLGEDCIDIHEVTILVKDPEVEQPPSAFSPNGDGWNDTWVIKNIEAYPDNEVRIYNRWGQIIYKQIGYTPENAFDGSRHGQQLPEATYYFIVELNTELVTRTLFQGTVVIIR